VALDEQLERELDRAARLADPAGVYEDLVRRRERLRVRRRVTAGAIAFAVFIGGAFGVYALSGTIGDDRRRPAAVGELTGRLVFSTITEEDGSRSSMGWHLVAMSPDGTDRVDIAPRGIHEAILPTTSPDGARIAFVGSEGKQHAVYVMDADGTDPQPILRFAEFDSAKALAWSPDGTRIAMVRETGADDGTQDGGWTTTIWTFAPDGTELRPITTTGRETSVAWSPDSSRLVFSRYEPIDPNDQDVANDIYVVDADGSNETRLSNDGNASSPAWSPDGTTIAFDRSASNGVGVDLALMEVDGSNVRPLTNAEGNEFGAAWSATGDAIVFSELQPDASREHSLAQVSVIRPDGSDYRVLTRSEISPAAIGIWWSVDPVDVQPAPDAVTGPTPVTGPDATGVGTTDLGLGYPVCAISTVRGHFATNATIGTAYGFTDASNGCPKTADAHGVQRLGIDLTGDGTVETSTDLEGCDPFCTAFAAPDFDGDGTDEVLVQNIQFTIAGVRAYDVGIDADGGFARPVTIASPGYPGEGLPPGMQPQFFIGGDGSLSDSLRCDGSHPNRTVAQASAVMDPSDSPDSVWNIDTTEYVLNPDGTMTVLYVQHSEEPADGDVSFAQSDGICGARLPYPYGGS
jgi:hypothetical protein